MSSVKFTFDVKDLASRLERAGPKAIKDTLRSCGNLALRSTHERFRQEIDPDGIPWKPHVLPSKSYRILWKEGDLFKSIVATFSKTKVVIGTALVYAGVHQRGAKLAVTPKQSVWMWANLFNKQGNPFRFKTIRIPKRTFLGFSEDDQKGFVVIANTVLKGALDGRR